jgi:hypothetical protein
VAKTIQRTTNVARSAKSSSGVRKSAALKGSTALARVVIETPPPKIDWDDAVAKGKALIAEKNQMLATAEATADQNDWALAELADQVGDEWGEGKLVKFASEIGMAHCSIKRRRSAFRNWKEIFLGDPGLRTSLRYSVARELEKHPDRERLVKENPKMTKREATAKMKEIRPPESKMARWWTDLLLRVSKAEADASVLSGDRQILRKVVQPTMLLTLREAGEAWVRLANSLEKLFKPADDEFDTAA